MRSSSLAIGALCVVIIIATPGILQMLQLCAIDQLGYLRAVGAPRYAAFGAGSGPSWYNWVQCTGTERNLTECSKSFSSHGNACSHSQDAGVVCSSEL